MIDLALRVLVIPWDQTKDPIPVHFVDRDGATRECLPYDLDASWRQIDDLTAWHEMTQGDEPAGRIAAHVDWRETLYGTPLLGFLVDAVVARRDEIQDLRVRHRGHAGEALDDALQSIFREIHSAWLLRHPNDGEEWTVRDQLLAGRLHLERDLRHREFQWSVRGECPTGLDESDTAFRFGGLGTHEIILYYDLVRQLLADCAEHVTDEVFVEGSRETQIAWLAGRRELWLDAVDDDELLGKSPREVIRLERQRIPLAVEQPAGPVDCDCPLCRLMCDDSSGVIFWHLDRYDQDQAFPFGWDVEGESSEASDFGEDDEDWESDRAELLKSSPPRAAPARPAADPLESVWKRVFVAGAPGEFSRELDLFAVAACTGELIADLKERAAERHWIDELNRQVDNFGEVFRQAPSEMLAPVVARFCEKLDEVEGRYAELGPKIADLQNRLLTLTQLVAD